jgi:hypothetical protein
MDVLFRMPGLPNADFNTTVSRQKSGTGSVLIYESDEGVIPLTVTGLNWTAEASCVYQANQETETENITTQISPCEGLVGTPCQDPTGGDPDPGGGCLDLDGFCKMIDWEQCSESPILIDMERDNFRLGPPGVGVIFDITGTNDPKLVQWVKAGEDDVFLARDLNGNGLVDDGSELFGMGTRLILEDHGLAPNGFVGLAQFDDLLLGGDEDGSITAADAIWPELLLWHDRDADGICRPEEMRTIEESDIERLDVVPRETRRRDQAGNWLRYWAWAHPGRGPKYKMVDVFFRIIDDSI